MKRILAQLLDIIDPEAKNRLVLDWKLKFSLDAKVAFSEAVSRLMIFYIESQSN